MKKYLIAICFLLLTSFSFGQLSFKEYSDLIIKARTLYEGKDYKNAAIGFSSAFRIGGKFVTNDDRWYLACSWAKAGLPDSAFKQLDIIAPYPRLELDFMIDIVTDDDCFLTLHNDKRWKDFKINILKIQGHAVEEYVKAIDFIRINDYDNAFYHLNIAAESKDLTFDCAWYMIINNFFLTGVEKNMLDKDKRWPELVNKIYISLNKKYIPASAFSNTIKSPKRLLIDGGHYSATVNGPFTTQFGTFFRKGTYATLTGTLQKSGFEVSKLEGKFDEASLKNTDMLIITNPLSDLGDSLFQRAERANQEFRWSDAATQSAYTKSEISEIESWVKNGGSLFLILDHAPNGKAGEALAAAFGIENRNVGTYDTLSLDPISDTAGGARNILFTRSKGLIGKHPIVKGIDSITTYTGESLIGPPGSEALLLLPSTATDLDWLPDTRQFRNRSAAGRLQAVAFDSGKGRVVMLGEAAITRPAMLSIVNRGNWPFILNILRWLAREKMD